ncbi:MAG TPA: hypothetical protein VFK68_02455 [Propionibacteriaceae bacterium]|nr:hypothetical protein [Propionibacteriaceae bacterium]
MTSDDGRDDELRKLATEVITELRESLRAANAESLTRGRQLMEDWVGDRSNRYESVHDAWARLENDPAAIVQGDYALLRTGLGRRAWPGGPLIDQTLYLERIGDDLLVWGSQLSSSIGVVVRWQDEEGYPRERVHPHTLGDGSHLVPYDEEIEGSPLRVISFDSSSITGFGTWTPEPDDAVLTSE